MSLYIIPQQRTSYPLQRAVASPCSSPPPRPVTQAQTKLYPPIGPNASSISPQRNSPGHLLLSIVRGSISESATPPPVTSAFPYPSSPVQGNEYRVSSSRSRSRSSRRS